MTSVYEEKSISTVASYDIALGALFTAAFVLMGKAVKSLVITLLRNAVLFIPGVILLNSLWQLNGVIAAQPVVETVLAVICIVMYMKDIKGEQIPSRVPAPEFR